MCEFAQRYEDRGIKMGMKQGMKQEIDHGIRVLVSSLREFNVADNDIINNISKQYQISKTAAKKYVA